MKNLNNPHRYFSILLFCFTCSLYTYGQNNIEGSVQDETGTPLAFANILLRKHADSTLSKGTIATDTGAFKMEAITSGKYFITVSMIGYQSVSTAPFDHNALTTLVLAPIVLIEGVALDEVVVSSKKNLYVQKIDRMVINVASSILATGSSALEVLERSPGVLVDRQNSAISLIGKSGVTVLIDGKQSYMPTSSLVQYLQGMSSDNIETIELITTPPANFDAEGNAGFINIVLKERTDVGLNGSYSISGGFGNGTTTADNINFNYRKNKINIFGNYSFLRNSQGQYFEIERSFIDSTSSSIYAFTESLREPIQRNHDMRIGLDYQVSDKTVVGLLLWAHDNKWTMNAQNWGFENRNGVSSSFVELLLSERNQLQHVGSNLNLKYTLKETAFVSFDLDYLKYGIENPTNYINTFYDGSNSFLREELTLSDKDTPIQIIVGKADYSDQINSEIKLDGGIKAAFSNFDNDVFVGTFDGQVYVEDQELTNFSTLNEKIIAAYGSANYTISAKTSLQLGLRYEHTDSKLTSDKEGTVVDRTYGNLFPTAYISHVINDSLSYNLSYSKRITRPTFNDMAPFVIFFDPNTFFSGNPAVQPAISNALKFDINYRSFLLSSQYSVEEGTISRYQSTFDQQNERFIFGAVNFDRTKIFSVTLGLPLTFSSWWKVQNNITFLTTKITNTIDNVGLNFQQKSLNINSTQSLIFSKNTTAEINVNYSSPSIVPLLGNGTIAEIFGMNLGVQKELNNSWGTLGFKVNDLFNSVKYAITSDIPEQSLITSNTFDFSNRTFLLTYSRSFGNKKLQSARQRGTGSEEEKRRVN